MDKLAAPAARSGEPLGQDDRKGWSFLHQARNEIYIHKGMRKPRVRHAQKKKYIDLGRTLGKLTTTTNAMGPFVNSTVVAQE